MKKKLFALVLACAMAASLVACGDSGSSSSSSTTAAAAADSGSSDSSGSSSSSGDLDFPKESLSMFVHAAAGGGSDSMARMIASVMEQNMGVPVVVDNKTGGTGSVCWQSLINSKPDGYTISTVASELTYIGALGYADIGVDDVDFLGLCQTWSGSLVVPADSEWETFDDFIEACKAAPGQISVGDGGTGNIWQIAAYIMERETGIEVNHVPFDGASGELTALLGGHCDAIVVGSSEAKANIDSGAMKCLCVFNDEPSSAVPDAPTAPELGYPDLICNVFVGIGCPLGVPDDIREYLVEQVKEAVNSDTFKDFTVERGTDWNYMGPDEFKLMAQEDEIEFTELINELGLAN